MRLHSHPSLQCVFRVAAGPRVGYGHVMRARALAQCLEVPASISIRGGQAARRAVVAMGCRLVEGRRSLAGADLLVVDDPSLKHGRVWIERARRSGVLSVSIHDGSVVQDADLVVSGSLGVGRPRTAAPVLKGVGFYLLDRRLAATRAQKPVQSHDRPRVLVALGGGHHVRVVAQRLVDAVRVRCPRASIVVAAGFSRGRREPLRHARWLSARTGLMHALIGCDVAIVAGGVTLYEACALGVPAVGLAVVPEQRKAIRAFVRSGALIDAEGTSFPGTVEGAAAGVARLLSNARLRTSVAARARRLVDGHGADRVAARIRMLLGQGARADA